jgi:hypothetical protein
MKPWLFILGGLIMAFGIPDLPDLSKWAVVQPVTVADRVVYVWDKDGEPVPPAVRAGLAKLNTTIKASAHEMGGTDGTGETPEQYKLAEAAAEKAGVPALVVMAGGKVIRVVKVKTEAEVLEAAND